MENREMPILHKPQAFGQELPQQGLEAFCLSVPPDKQKILSSVPSLPAGRQV